MALKNVKIKIKIPLFEITGDLDNDKSKKHQTLPSYGSEVGYYIINKYSGKALDVSWKESENGVLQYDWHKGQNQRWLLRHTEEGYLAIFSALTGKCLDVEWGGADDGKLVVQWFYTGGWHQQWKIGELEDGSYSITARHSGKVLDAGSWKINNGVQPKQWAWHGENIQRWWIKPAVS